MLVRDSSTPARASAQQFAEDQAQVERRHMDQLPLEDVVMFAQVRAPHPAGIVTVREAAFHQFAASPEQTLPVVALYPPPIGLHRLLLTGLALPLPPALLLPLRDVTAHLTISDLFQRRTGVISLVGHHLLDTLQVDLGRFLRM